MALSRNRRSSRTRWNSSQAVTSALLSLYIWKCKLGAANEHWMVRLVLLAPICPRRVGRCPSLLHCRQSHSQPHLLYNTYSFHPVSSSERSGFFHLSCPEVPCIAHKFARSTIRTSIVPLRHQPYTSSTGQDVAHLTSAASVDAFGSS